MQVAIAKGSPTMRRFHRVTWLLVALAGLVAFGCTPAFKRNPLPEELMGNAQVLGIAYARFLGTEPDEVLDEQLRIFVEQAATSGLSKRPARYLALSGGAADGAFGVGLLAGWTEAGDRPEFTYVTGISTGALIAPMAFLGSDYDAALSNIYTSMRTEDVFIKKAPLAALTSDSFTRSTPLRHLIAEHITDEVIDEIAREYKRGRRLFIGTTNVDSLRAVHWNIGAIAASNQPGANDLIRDILLASASIPAVFPPVYFEVVADGETYDEMHVDGGVSNQVFVYSLAVNVGDQLAKAGIPGDARLYVIRNSRLDPTWRATDPKLFSIAGRSISGLLRTQGIGDLFTIYLGALRDGIDFNLAYIPSDFREEAQDVFDPEYMTKLYKLGYEMAKRGYPWHKVPPGYVPPQTSGE
jgi:predicted acylesterase/phospholipase RssA